VTEIESSTGGVTVNAALAAIEPTEALMVEPPTPVPVAVPPEIVATVNAEELQLKVVVKFCVEPSL
jgi:hypothetical protein